LNCFSTVCGPLPPSFLNLRSTVTPNDNINMTTTGMLNINSTEETIRYHPDENGRYNNYVIYLNYELLKIRKKKIFFYYFSEYIQRQYLHIPIINKLVIHHVIMCNMSDLSSYFLSYRTFHCVWILSICS
jgi:hypothetical protein